MLRSFYFCHQPGDLSTIVNDKGCLLAGEEWLEMNLVTVAGVAVGIAFLQVHFYFIFVSCLNYVCSLYLILSKEGPSIDPQSLMNGRFLALSWREVVRSLGD